MEWRDPRSLIRAAPELGDRIALFLDFDGTLVDISDIPQQTAAPLSLAPVLNRLASALNGALAIVSGRTISDLDHRLAPYRGPAAGVHGAELRLRRDDVVEREIAPLDSEIVAHIRALTAFDPRLIVEDKGVSVTVHYRRAPELGPRIQRDMEAFVGSAPGALRLLHGRMVVEILGAAFSKGQAVELFMRSPPFLGRRPVMIGDDRTDVSAFDACRLLNGGGLRVAGEFFSAYHAEFSDPQAVRDWLAAMATRMPIATETN